MMVKRRTREEQEGVCSSEGKQRAVWVCAGSTEVKPKEKAVEKATLQKRQKSPLLYPHRVKKIARLCHACEDFLR
jgi:hypothetical protein